MYVAAVCSSNWHAVASSSELDRLDGVTCKGKMKPGHHSFANPGAFLTPTALRSGVAADPNAGSKLETGKHGVHVYTCPRVHVYVLEYVPASGNVNRSGTTLF